MRPWPRGAAPSRQPARFESNRSPGRPRGFPERWGGALLWLLVLVPPEVLFPTAKEAFRLPKLLVSEWLGLASLLPLAWGLRRVSAVTWSDLWRRPVIRAALPALLVASLGALATLPRHPFHQREALADLWIGAACLVGWSLALPAERIERLLRGILLPATALALLGILQYHDIWRPLLFSGYTLDPRLAITSTAGNPGDLAAYLVLPCLIAQWLLGRNAGAPWGSGRWLTALALALSAYALALTQTLASLAGAGIGTLVFWSLFWRATPSRRRIPALWAGLAALAVAVVLLLPPLRARAGAKLAQAVHGDWNAVLTGRLDGWSAAVWMLSEHPWSGVGQGAFRPEYIPAKLALEDRGLAFSVGRQQGSFSNAHNDILEAGADWGVPGLLAVGWGLWVLITALHRGFRGRDATGAGIGDAKRAERASAAFAWSAAAGLAVLTLFYFPFRIALVAFPALLLLAWIFRRAGESELSGATRPARPESSAGAGRAVAAARSGIPGALLLGPVLALLATALVLQTGRLIDRRYGSRLLAQVEIISGQIEAGRLPTTLIPHNLEALRIAAAVDPVEVGIPIARGTQFLLLPQPRPEEALAALERADRLEPRPVTYVLMGRALLQAGRVEEAKRRFALALRLDPSLQAAVPRL